MDMFVYIETCPQVCNFQIFILKNQALREKSEVENRLFSNRILWSAQT